jgi:Sulfocyanin (SoxE) domain
MKRRWRLGLIPLCAGLVGLALTVQADEEIKPSWMTVEADKQLVRLLFVAASDGSNGTMNFNGYGKGDMTVTVPLGWKVAVEFQNTGLGALPHSLAVTNEVAPPPNEGGNPAFPRALTRRLVPGMMAGETDTFDFVANKEGRFLWWCGVAAHGVAGMWDYLVVSADTKAPGVTVKVKK